MGYLKKIHCKSQTMHFVKRSIRKYKIQLKLTGTTELL